LAVAVEEQLIQAAVEVVMVGNVAPRAWQRVELAQAAGGETKGLEPLRPARPVGVIEIGEDQLEKVVDRALFDDEAPSI